MAAVVMGKLLAFHLTGFLRGQPSKALAATAEEDLVCCREQGVCEPTGLCHLQASAEKSLPTVQSQVGFSLVFQFLPPVLVLAVGGQVSGERTLDEGSEVRGHSVTWVSLRLFFIG